jgi:hypothetical protein
MTASTAYTALHAEISAYLANHLTEGTDINPLPCTFDVPEALRADYVQQPTL